MKKLSVFLLIFSMILSSVTPAYSRPKKAGWWKTGTATIQGQVTDSVTNQAISSAAVRAGRYKAATDANGNYIIKNIKVWFWGRVFRVKASAKGYYSSSRWIYVRKGKTYTLNFRLRPRKPLILVKITSPEDNSYIRGTNLDVSVSWQGRAGIIDLYLDNNLVDSYRTWRWWHRSGNHIFKVDLSSQQDGEHKLKAIAYRSHRRRGYKAESKEIIFILDNTSPVISDISPENNALINNNQPEISAVLSDATSGIDKETIVLKLDDVEVTATYDEATGKLNYTPIIMLEDGSHTISIEVKDRTGNEVSASSTFTVDVTSPVISNIQPEDGSETTETMPIISANYSDSGSGINAATAKILVSNIDQTSHAMITETSISYKPADDLLYGVIGVHIEIKDNAENLAQVDYEFTIRDYVQELEDGVSEGDWDKLCEAADKLVQMGESVIPALLSAFSDESKSLELRCLIAELFSEIGDERAVEPLLAAATSAQQESLRVSSIIALGHFSDAVEPLINLLREDESERIRKVAAFSLGAIGNESAVAPLVEALQDEDKWVRTDAVRALGDLEAATAVPSLIDKLSDSDEYVRYTAAHTLGNLGAKESMQTLVDIMLSDTDFQTRKASSEALKKLVSPADEDMVPDLINAFKDNDDVVRRNAAEALVKIGSSAVSVLLAAYPDAESYTKVEIAFALGQIGDPQAIDLLTEVMEESERKTEALHAAVALYQLGVTEETYNFAIEALFDEKEGTRESAAIALGNMGDERAVPSLESTLHDLELFVRDAASVALKEITGIDYEYEH